ncbi:phospholipid phosphatase 1 isoform X2 [Anabrus simplex]|uniref:phospholipid phosphatase 1 isoform X2 n=1 Tax=Anabrus simplex TaxID=316456 RepID=UPI0034DCE467
MDARTRATILVTVLALTEFGLIPNKQSGFYCDDPKITFVFRGDTISLSTLLTGTICIPFIVLWLVETCCFQFDEYEVCKSIKRRSAVGIRQALVWYREFLLGLGLVLFVTDVSKLLVGEPRPHFLDTCRPDQAVNCTTGFVSNYTCTNKEASQRFVRDATKSFPSGHASISVYTAIYLMWFIQVRVPDNITYLLVPWLHCLCALWCLVCSLTRITDHRHHWWDVLAGSIFGLAIAVFTVKLFCKNFFNLEPSPQSVVRSSKADGVIRENGHVSHNSYGNQRHQSIRRLLSSTSSYTGSIAPEERELREAH